MRSKAEIRPDAGRRSIGVRPATGSGIAAAQGVTGRGWARAHPDDGRGEAEVRLDPVRWRRPGRPTMLRSALVAGLVATAALLMWARPVGTGPPPRPAATTPSAPAASAAGRPSGPPGVPAGLIGVPIRLAEPTALKLIHPGDRVDVLRVPETSGSPQVIATAALVLGVTGAEDPVTGGLLLALTPAEARRTVTAPGGGYAVLLRPDG